MNPFRDRHPDYAECRGVTPASPLPGRRGWIVVGLFVLCAFAWVGHAMAMRAVGG